MESGQCDVLVVGNGIIGLSVAFELSQRSRDLRIAVIGPPARDGAASAAAGAMLNCFAEVTGSTLAHPASAAKFAVGRAALDAWPAWLDKVHDAAGGTKPRLRDGTFVVLGAKAADQSIASFHAIRAALAAHEEPFEEVAPADIEGLSPEVNARPVRALRLREGSIDAREVLALLESAVESHGVGIVPATVEELVITGGRVAGVRLSGGARLSAPTVVVAAGSLTQRFIEQLPLGSVPPMLHGTGLAVQTLRSATAPQGFDQVVRTPNQAGACGLHLVPMPERGREYIGATNILSFRPPQGPGVGVSFNLLRNACEQLDHRIGTSHVSRWLVGRRPVALDGLPLMGRVSTCEGLVFATGIYRDGFHSSPVIARHIADVVLGTAVSDPDFEHFAAERAPIERTTVAGSIDDFVDHETDTAVMLGVQLPYCVDHEALPRLYRRTAEDLVERLGEDIALLPEVLNALRNEPDDGFALFLPYLRAARAWHGGTRAGNGRAPAAADGPVRPAQNAHAGPSAPAR
ncbi:NAD(P)/FAD-dependent oxidoreductase [Kitasatospora sp. NPDC018619]|uniref:NAD(P)/FAD-dependent oxidoreductase n=1 Tax=unclassified Kitasatospora TaxID=2633591 RepID=UPI0037893B1B